MPSSYTTSLRLTLPATGELAGQWGTTVNTGITELLDSAVAGTASISTWGGAGVSYTLSNNSGTADEARKMFIVATGTPGEAKNVICPAVSKFYVFRNDTTGGFALTLKTPSGTGIAVPAGQYKFLYCDGTNVVEAFNSSGALTLSGALSVGSTTTLSGLTASTALALNASKEVVSVTNTGTGNNVLATSPVLTTPDLGTPSAVTLTNATGLPLSTGVTGTLVTTNGGTGVSSWTAGDLPYYATGTALSKLGIGTNGQILTSTGSAPQWTSLSSVGVTTFSGGTTGLTPSTPTSGAITLAGTLGVTNGGTGNTTIPALSVFVANTLNTLTAVTPTAGQSVRINAGGTAWEAYTPVTAAGDVVAASNNAFTGANTFYNATGQTFGTATAAQDGIIIAGRAGGTSTYRVTLAPGTLSASRSVTFPDADINFTTGLGVAQGGTGQTSYTNGQLLIGNTTGNTLTKSTLTAGTGISITNGTGSITIANTSAAPVSPVTNVTSQTVTLTTTNFANALARNRRIALDADREMLIISGSVANATAIHAVVYNASTNTFGSPVVVRAATAALIGAILQTTDQVMVVSCNGTTGLEAVILSVSTNTITVNTAATATLAGNIAIGGTNSYESLVQVGSSFVVSYGRATNTNAIRALTVSGTTVTIGAETTLTAANTAAAYLAVISSSVVLCLNASSTLLYATPYSVSGTTLTLGTGATTATTDANWYPVGALQSGQNAVLYNNTSLYGAIISVSVTTATISTAQLSTGSAVSAAQITWNVSGDKVLVHETASNSANVLTNTAGTASAGTSITGLSTLLPTPSTPCGSLLMTGSLGGVAKLEISGSNAVATLVTGQCPTATATSSNRSAWNGTQGTSGSYINTSTKAYAPAGATGALFNSDGTYTQAAPTGGFNSGRIFGNVGDNWAWGITLVGQGASTASVTLTKVTL